MTTVLIGTVIFIALPQYATKMVQQDAWITAHMASFWGILVVLTIVALSKRFPGYTLTEYLPIVIGKPLGLVLGLLYASWFMFIGAFTTLEVTIFFSSLILPVTPFLVIVISLMIVVYYALQKGLEVWVRANELLLVLIILSIILVVFLPYNYMDLRRLLPIGEHDLSALLEVSLKGGSLRGEIMMLGMFIPLLTCNKNVNRNMILTVVMAGVFLGAVEMAAVAVFGGANTANSEFTIHSLASMVNIGTVISRIEILVVIMWLAASFIKICALLYCSAVATADSVGLKDYKFLLLPLIIISILLVQSYGVAIESVEDLVSDALVGFGLLTFELGIPVLLLLIAVMRKKRQTAT
ncbi:MAG: endospore germination permease [Syntrophomonadaceae bacterium]|nr:endospore germination permease [Syntrophomonadaceae bacterium]